MNKEIKDARIWLEKDLEHYKNLTEAHPTMQWDEDIARCRLLIDALVIYELTSRGV